MITSPYPSPFTSPALATDHPRFAKALLPSAVQSGWARGVLLWNPGAGSAPKVSSIATTTAHVTCTFPQWLGSLCLLASCVKRHQGWPGGRPREQGDGQSTGTRPVSHLAST